MNSDPDQVGSPLSEPETRTYLKSRGHGVLSLASEDRAYGIPISFGFDEKNDRFLFEFLNLPDSKKAEFTDPGSESSLTVYEYDAGKWKSCIVIGEIHPVETSSLSAQDISSFFSQADDGAEPIRWGEASQLDRQWYELKASSITGRQSTSLQ